MATTGERRVRGDRVGVVLVHCVCALFGAGGEFIRPLRALGVSFGGGLRCSFFVKVGGFGEAKAISNRPPSLVKTDRDQ